MLRNKSAKSHPRTRRSEHTFNDQSADEVSEIDTDGSIEKDQNELDLERVVFGDEAGFRKELQQQEEKQGFLIPASGSDAHPKSPSVTDEGGLEAVDDADLFFLDSGPSGIDVQKFPQPQGSDNEETGSADDNAALWIDSDDERIVVSLASNTRLRKLRNTESEDLVNGKEYIKRLRRQFERLYPAPEWAKANTAGVNLSKKRRRPGDGPGSPDENTSDDEESHATNELKPQPLAQLLQGALNITRPIDNSNSQARRKVRPEIIDVQRTKDVNTTKISSVTSLAFHPTHPLLLSSGPSSTISLHHISPHSPNPNPLLTDLHLRSTPLTTSLFHPPSGNKIYFSGRRRYFHIWNLESGKVDKVSQVIGHGDAQRTMERFKLSPCGRWLGLVGSGRKGGGAINVLDANTCQWIAEVRVEGKGGISDYEWWGDGDGMIVLGKGGEAVEWSGREKRVVARWIDEGAVGTTVMASGGRGLGPAALGGDRWLAVGSSSGIVNLYDRRKWLNPTSLPPHPKPERVLDQLTTPVSHLAFSPNGQILCMASRWKRDALRLVHLPSCTVYRNWPTGSTPLGRIMAVAWTPNSEMLAVANEQGKIRLWEIRA